MLNSEANMSQARELEGDDRDDLVSAPKMVMQVRVHLRSSQLSPVLVSSFVCS